MISAKNALEPGIAAMEARMRSGRLKVFSTLQNFRREFGLYRRDDKGKIPEGQDDHLMDCGRYGVMTGTRIARAKPDDMPLWQYDGGAGFDPLAGA